MCTVNPQVGREDGSPFPKASRHREVVIIGGPAGMVAAITAAKRGHRVTLVEKTSQLGGNLLAASGVFFKNEIEELKKYLVSEMERNAIRIELGIEADGSVLRKFLPEVLILATGTEPAMPTIRGIDGRNVSSVVGVLSGRCDTGAKVIVVGGGMMGVRPQSFKRSRKEVVLVDIHGLDKLGLGMESRLRHWFLLTLWPKLKIPLPYTKVEEVNDRGLIVRDQKWGGRLHLIEGDSIVFGLGLKAHVKPNSLLDSGVAKEIHQIGDCVRPRSILEAINEGYQVASIM
jgi:pyruvate/2-oxoglutarate dehydrogenase complex dihydrolipoamide dehydrogenase (E3) component